MADYTNENIDMMAGLFPRVGFWISHAEDTDVGEESETLELTSMKKAITRIRDKSSDATVSASAEKALSILKPDLDDTEELLSSDITAAAKIFLNNRDEDGFRHFSKALMYVGLSVARAYREELDHHEDEFMLENLLARISGYLNRESDPQEFKDLNISPAEDSALTMISEALRIAQRGEDQE